MTTFDARVQAFADEYRALCEKHKLIVTYDMGYVTREVSELPADEFDDGWSMWPNEAPQ